MKNLRLVLLGALLFMLTACVMPMVHVPPNPGNPIYTVAVLPMYNATNDVDGPVMVRELVEKRIHNWQYSVKPLNESDQILRDSLGLTLGSQLEDVTPKQLGEALGVDGVLYGYLIDFDQTTTGVLNVRRVRAGFKLVDTKTGKAVWTGGIGVKTEVRSGGALGKGASALSDISDISDKVNSNSIKGLAGIRWIANWVKLESHTEKDAGTAALFSLGQMAFEKALSGHLKHESEEVVRRVFGDFPAGHGSGEVYVAAAPPTPAVKHENREPAHMVPPYLMDMNDADFFAEVTMTMTSSKSDKSEVVMHLTRSKEKTRMEMISFTMSEPMPFKFPKMVTIVTGGKEIDSYTLYPEKKKYTEHKFSEKEAMAEKDFKIEKVKIGEETIDGHPCDKYKVTVTEKDGDKITSIVWKAKDMNGFMLRAETEDKGAKSVVTFKKVKLGKQDPKLFVVPPDYTKSDNPMELFMQ